MLEHSASVTSHLLLTNFTNRCTHAYCAQTQATMAVTKEGNSAFNNLLIAVQKKYNDPRAGISFSGRKVKVCVCVLYEYT